MTTTTKMMMMMVVVVAVVVVIIVTVVDSRQIDSTGAKPWKLVGRFFARHWNHFNSFLALVPSSSAPPSTHLGASTKFNQAKLHLTLGKKATLAYLAGTDGPLSTCTLLAQNGQLVSVANRC